MKTLKPTEITPQVKAAASAVLLAKAYAMTMREAVDKIQREILSECPLRVADENFETRGEERITEPRYTYLAEQDDLEDYWYQCDKRERAAGIKPDTMPDGHCPALSAEYIQTQAQWLLVDCTADMLGLQKEQGELTHNLLCYGLETYFKFIDTVLSMVVNQPDFKNPLIA